MPFIKDKDIRENLAMILLLLGGMAHAIPGPLIPAISSVSIFGISLQTIIGVFSILVAIDLSLAMRD